MTKLSECEKWLARTEKELASAVRENMDLRYRLKIATEALENIVGNHSDFSCNSIARFALKEIK